MTRSMKIVMLSAGIFLILASLVTVVALRGRKHPSERAERTPFTAGKFVSGAPEYRGPNPAEVFDSPATVDLTVAALRGNVPAIRKALSRGADLNGAGRHGLTPLHLTLLNFSSKGFEVLLHEGANANIPAENGDSVMSLAPIMPGDDWLAMASRNGGNINFTDRNARTPLMLAARHGRMENVHFLISKGAGINTADRNGDTALIHVFHALNPDVELAKLLIDNGAVVVHRNRAELTARDYAETHRNPALLSIFPPE